MKKRLLAVCAAPVILLGALVWAQTTALRRAEANLRQGLPYRADWSSLPLRVAPPASLSVRAPKSLFHVVLTPQEIRALAPAIALEKRDRYNTSRGPGTIGYDGITLWLEPNQADADGAEVAVSIVWGLAIEGDTKTGGTIN